MAPQTWRHIIASRKKPDLTPEQLQELVITTLDNDKAEDIVSIDLQGKTAIADFMVVCSGRSSRQIGALADKLAQKLSEHGYKSRTEGKSSGDWVLLDGGDFIVHIFRPEVRDFYQIEKIWNADFKTADHTLYLSA